MARELQRIPFTSSHLEAVKGFDCGPQEWEAEGAIWISSPADSPESALRDIANLGTRVWLYATDEDGLVGFGSLGKSPGGWRLKGKKAPLEPMQVIPWVAVHRKYWGKPKEAGEQKFSTRILCDLIAEAIQARDTLPYLGLMVDPRSGHAIRCYEDFGFERLPEPYKDKSKGIDYIRMVLVLEEYMKAGPPTPVPEA